MRNMTAIRTFRIVAQIQTLVLILRKRLRYFTDATPIPLAYNSLRQPLRAKYGMLSLGSFAAPKAFTSARIESQRRTRRPAAACTLATFPSDGRVATHSNMRTAVLCRNFSDEASRLMVHKRNTHRPAPAAPKVNESRGLEQTGWQTGAMLGNDSDIAG